MILTEKALRQFAKSLLFETEKNISLNEMFQPDDMQPQQHINYGGHYHQPGPDPEADRIENVLEKLPIDPQVTVSSAQVSYSVPTKVMTDPSEHTPTSKKQLALTVGSTLDNMDLSNKDIKKIWNGINKILDNIDGDN